MGGQLDGNFPGSLPHKFILIVTLIICFVVNKFFFSLSFLSICSAVTWLQCRKRRPNGPFTHTLRVSLPTAALVLLGCALLSCAMRYCARDSNSM